MILDQAVEETHAYHRRDGGGGGGERERERERERKKDVRVWGEGGSILHLVHATCQIGL